MAINFALRDAALVSLLFGITVGYSGPGYNLHWLSVSIFVTIAWLATLVARLDFSRLQLSWGWLSAAMAGYLTWLLIAPFFSSYPYATSTTAMGLAWLPLMFFARLLTPDDSTREWRHPLWLSLALAGIVLAIWGAFDLLVLGQRAHGPLLDPNAYAALINIFLLASAHLYLSLHSPEKHRRAHLLLVLIVPLSVAQAASLSRGALLAFLTVLPALILFAKRHPALRLRIAWLLIVLVSAHALIKILPVGDRTGLQALLTAPTHYAEKDAATRERLLLWKSTLRMISNTNIVVGDGLGTFKIYYPPYRDKGETSAGNFAHNDYLQALQEGGVVQFIFFVTLAVFAPLGMLVTTKRQSSGGSPHDPQIAIGLLLGICCVSLHAVINFIHYVGPISLLSGLCLAEAWKATRPRHVIRFSPSLRLRVKPTFFKSVLILALIAPGTVLIVDGIIFKLFGTNEALHGRLEPGIRFTIMNLVLAARPDNPIPRIMLVRALISAAERSEPTDRELLIRQAERETSLLSRNAPALAIGQHYFTGKIKALKGTDEDLRLARDDLELAVTLVPPATAMRLELVKVYQRLGERDKAFSTVQEARKWLSLEVDYQSLAAFAREAEAVSRQHGDEEEIKFWSWIRARLTALGHPS